MGIRGSGLRPYLNPFFAFSLCASGSLSSSRPAPQMLVCAMTFNQALEPLRGVRSGPPLRNIQCVWRGQTDITGQDSERGNAGIVATEGSPCEGPEKSFDGVVSSRVTLRSNMKTGENCYYSSENLSPARDLYRLGTGQCILMEVHFGLCIYQIESKEEWQNLWKGESAPGDMGFNWEVGSSVLWLFSKIEKLPTVSEVLYRPRINLFLPTTLRVSQARMIMTLRDLPSSMSDNNLWSRQDQYPHLSSQGSPLAV